MAQQRGRVSGYSQPGGRRRPSTAAGATGRGGAGQPRGGAGADRARLRAVIAPVVDARGFDLEDLTVSRVGRRHLVKVTVDRDEGVGSDAVATLSRDIAAAIDEAERTGGEFTSGEYVLEVSSPGVDRPLTEPRHWRRNVGRLVKVRVGDRQVTGRVSRVDDDGVLLDVDGEAVAARYAELGAGRVQVEFRRLDEVADEDLTAFDDEDDDHDDEDQEGVDEE
ncbi:MAG TPA: ribosome maturation factor RimP [Micromonosporaceae bacterium]